MEVKHPLHTLNIFEDCNKWRKVYIFIISLYAVNIKRSYFLAVCKVKKGNLFCCTIDNISKMIEILKNYIVRFRFTLFRCFCNLIYFFFIYLATNSFVTFSTDNYENILNLTRISRMMNTREQNGYLNKITVENALNLWINKIPRHILNESTRMEFLKRKWSISTILV